MIDVALTAEALVPARTAVVVDVLRATSTIAQALAAGYRRVLVTDTIERARALRAPGRVIAGERDWERPEGFDLGNSPSELDPPRGTELVLSTTNGCPAILGAARRADTVLIGCLLNLDAVCAELGGDVAIVCAGVEGRPSLEDTYVAGRIAARLHGERTDTARVAQAVARGYRSAAEALDDSAGARALRRLGLGGDVDWCARESTLNLVPRVVEVGPHLAAVAVQDTPSKAGTKSYSLTINYE